MEFDFVDVDFAGGVDAAYRSSDCRGGALLIEPVGPKLEAIGVRGGALERESAIREFREYDLLDGVAFEARQHVGNRVFNARDVLDDNRILEQRCNPVTDARAGFVLSREHPGERFVVSTQYERPREEKDAKVGEGGDDGKTLAQSLSSYAKRGQKLFKGK